MVPENKIVVLLFHPLLHRSRVNRLLADTVEAIEEVSVRYMYDLYPDFHINIKEEQNILLENDIIVWQHPFYWYNCPSLMKEWLDLVLEHGFAYGREGRALEGKKIMSAITTGGRKETYASDEGVKFSIRQLLAPFEQTVQLCRMDFLPPFLTHGTHLLNNEEIEKAASHYGRVIRTLAKGGKDAQLKLNAEYINELIP